MRLTVRRGAVTRYKLLRIALLLASGVGWGIALGAAYLLLTSPSAGVGRDSHAYWLAGARVLAGEPLYFATALDDLGGYLYPPFFAQMWAPLSLLPEVVAAWGWRLLGVLSIRYMAGSWLVSGIWMLFPGTLTELGAGNVTFQVAALTVAGLRGRAEGIFPASAVKFSAVLVAPFIWIRRPRARRGLIIGAVVALVLVLSSVVFDPGAWVDYVRSLTSQGGLDFAGTPILHLLPSSGADYALRLVIAAAVVAVAVRRNSVHLAFVAAFIATPTLWPQRFAVLLALPTLEGDTWVRELFAKRSNDEDD